MAKYIYFDHAATTPVHKGVLKAMSPYWSDIYGNASSTHQYGQKASAAITESRKLIADFFYCQPEELIFTSGATESNNTAIKGVARFYKKKFAVKNIKKAPHLIVSAIEHPSVLESALALERNGCEVTFVQPQADGVIRLDNIIETIKDNTVLISVMYVNNETGAIQPVQAVGKKLIEINKERIDKDLPRIYFHVDAVQGFSYLNCRPDHIKVDLMSFSGHKIYGPKGIGLLYIRGKTPIIRMQDGGHQERTLRAGTTNTTGIVGFGSAVELHMKNGEAIAKQIKPVSKYLYKNLSNIKGLYFNSDPDKCIDAIVNFAVDNVSGDDLQIKLDLKKVATSMGAACAAGAVQASTVLMAMGQSKEKASQGIRISLGKQNTLAEAKKFVSILAKIIQDWSDE